MRRAVLLKDTNFFNYIGTCCSASFNPLKCREHKRSGIKKNCILISYSECEKPSFKGLRLNLLSSSLYSAFIKQFIRLYAYIAISFCCIIYIIRVARDNFIFNRTNGCFLYIKNLPKNLSITSYATPFERNECTYNMGERRKVLIVTGLPRRSHHTFARAHIFVLCIYITRG